MRDVAVLVPAGGAGTRMGGRTPKQFLALGGAPILAVTVRRLVRHPRVVAVVVAAPEARVARTRRLLAGAAGRVPVTVVAGGDTRQESVWRAVQAAPPEAAVVVVHDAVRPFVTPALVETVAAAARAAGAAICALPIAETVKRVRDGVVETTLERSTLWAVQTPQAFHAPLLREAHEKARRDGFVGTDEAMLVERLGHRVRVVPGDARNIKITTPADLRQARTWAGR
ncbi:MAG: 2-C-methyl-D-erythritol 4-phosphate cytidylyltransferase [Candidatus Rokuibacteriota bacterium]